MSDRFPYNVESSKAMLWLLQEKAPALGLNKHNVRFNRPIFRPTGEEPGLTYIEVHHLDTGREYDFAYTRLDLGIALGELIEVTLESPVSTAEVIEAINEKYEMQLGQEDVYPYGHGPIYVGDNPWTFKLKANPSSLVWYGEVWVRVNKSSAIPSNARLMEDGQPRLMEDGSFQLLEG